MHTQNTLLQEMLIKPAQEILTERFNNNEEIRCSGKCKSGTCMTAMNTNENLEIYADKS